MPYFGVFGAGHSTVARQIPYRSGVNRVELGLSAGGVGLIGDDSAIFYVGAFAGWRREGKRIVIRSGAVIAPVFIDPWDKPGNWDGQRVEVWPFLPSVGFELAR